jgi:hypothetical protein
MQRFEFEIAPIRAFVRSEMAAESEIVGED